MYSIKRFWKEISHISFIENFLLSRISALFICLCRIMKELYKSRNKTNTPHKICHEHNSHSAIQIVFKVPHCEPRSKLMRLGILYWDCTTLCSTNESALKELLKLYRCDINIPGIINVRDCGSPSLTTVNH